MITLNEYNQITEMIHRYCADERSITVNEIRTFGERLTPTSPKSGKEVTFGTMCNYLRGKIPSHCSKHDLLCVLATIKQTNDLKPERKLGFFNA